MVTQVKTELNGVDFIIETGKLAKQAGGAVTVTFGDLVVFSAVCGAEPREGIDFFPLSVDYREKTSAIGKFPGGYMKREGRPSDKEILTSRLIDRPLRPLFPDGYCKEVQIISTVFSADEANDPDVYAIVASSAALMISDIPFTKPVGAVRVGRIDGKFVINPTYTQLEKESELDLVVAGTKTAVLMVEGSAKEISESDMLEAVMFAHEEIKKLTEIQEELRKLCGKPKKEFEAQPENKEIKEELQNFSTSQIKEAVLVKGKDERKNALKEVYNKSKEHLLAKSPNLSEQEKEIESGFKKLEKDVVRKLILNEDKRSDGRTHKDIRDITVEVGFLPRTHGSALFTRGETQAIVMATLGNASDAQRSEGFDGETSKTFMLHYSFPPFSVGEVKPMRGPGRREVGHGTLAERSLLAVLPTATDFPYTIRIVSDILESNGSSSMASVCGGTLSLMDAGVPIKSPVAGIAMGLVKEDDQVVILSDILGSEDALGDMDFKVAGTKDGITAFQMDIKIEGINREIMEKALNQAKEGRLHILGKMMEVIEQPRANLSKYAPKNKVMVVDPDKIGTIIGPGGKMIKKICEEFGVEVNIEQEGNVYVSSVDEDGLDKAMNYIASLVAEVEVGKVYDGIVKKVMDFGVFVEVLPGKEGLVHISKFANHRVNNMHDEAKEGDQFKVKVMEIDDKGRINLSRKAVLEGGE